MFSNKSITFATTSFVTANGLSVQSRPETKAQAQSLASSQFLDDGIIGTFPEELWCEPFCHGEPDWHQPWLVPENPTTWDESVCDLARGYCFDAWDWTDCSGESICEWGKWSYYYSDTDFFNWTSKPENW